MSLVNKRLKSIVSAAHAHDISRFIPGVADKAGVELIFAVVVPSPELKGVNFSEAS